MYIYIEDRAIFNTEQIAEICVYKKTDTEWRLCAIIGGEECRIASYYKVKKEQAEKFKAYAKQKGTTANAMLKDYVLDIIKEEEQG